VIPRHVDSESSSSRLTIICEYVVPSIKLRLQEAELIFRASDVLYVHAVNSAFTFLFVACANMFV
jgi:hypothetical protein